MIKINVSSWEVLAKKAQELTKMKIVQEEFIWLQAEQEAEKRRQSEPTSLIGAVKALNVRNANVRVLTKETKPIQGAQQRLRQRSVLRKAEPRDRSSSGSSVQYLGERQRSPERERERGTTSRTTARTSSPKFAKAPSVRFDSGEESSDSEEMDKIRMQRYKVHLETVKLERMVRKHAEAKKIRK